MPAALETLRHLGRALAFAVEAVWAYKLRSVFVAAAIALGIAALTIIVTSVDGAQRRAVEIVDTFGPDAVFILGGDIMSRAPGRRSMTLTWDDARAMEQSLPGAYLVVPMRARMGLRARSGNRNADLPALVGSTPGYVQAWNWPLSEGRDLSADDVRLGAKVALIGDSISRELFGDASPLGRVVHVGNLPVRVVGRLSYRGVGGGHGTIDDRMVIPITTLTQRFNMDRKYFRALRVKFHNPERMAAHVENLRSLLRHRHGLTGDTPDDFTLLTADEILKFIGMLKGSLVAFLGVTATAAMVVGGFVLANLFYISVSERTEEIGLRKAMGATGWQITAQFLFEAALLTLAGALAGMALGMGMGQLLSRLGVLEILFSAKVFLLALGSALAIGLLFGLRPARRAARLDPVAALRGEGA